MMWKHFLISIPMVVGCLLFLFLENAGELRFSILRGKWDKNPVTTHTTNATLNSYSRAV